MNMSLSSIPFLLLSAAVSIMAKNAPVVENEASDEIKNERICLCIFHFLLAERDSTNNDPKCFRYGKE